MLLPKHARNRRCFFCEACAVFVTKPCHCYKRHHSINNPSVEKPKKIHLIKRGYSVANPVSRDLRENHTQHFSIASCSAVTWCLTQQRLKVSAVPVRQPRLHPHNHVTFPKPGDLARKTSCCAQRSCAPRRDEFLVDDEGLSGLPHREFGRRQGALLFPAWRLVKFFMLFVSFGELQNLECWNLLM